MSTERDAIKKELLEELSPKPGESQEAFDRRLDKALQDPLVQARQFVALIPDNWGEKPPPTKPPQS